jgi:hypothetical protein
MAKYFSKSTGGFYTPEVHGKNMPADVVEISDADWGELFEQQRNGKRITANASGYPIAVDRTRAVAQS